MKKISLSQLLENIEKVVKNSIEDTQMETQTITDDSAGQQQISYPFTNLESFENYINGIGMRSKVRFRIRTHEVAAGLTRSEAFLGRLNEYQEKYRNGDFGPTS